MAMQPWTLFRILTNMKKLVSQALSHPPAASQIASSVFFLAQEGRSGGRIFLMLCFLIAAP